MLVIFYDRVGNAIAYSEDGEHIYLFSGEAVSYLDADAIYTYRGEQLGWFENGWIRDRHGRCVAYSDSATEGPQRPSRRLKPQQLPRQARPIKDPQDSRTLRPIHSNAWSTQSASEFFSRQPRRWPGGLSKGE